MGNHDPNSPSLVYFLKSHSNVTSLHLQFTKQEVKFIGDCLPKLERVTVDFEDLEYIAAPMSDGEKIPWKFYEFSVNFREISLRFLRNLDLKTLKNWSNSKFSRKVMISSSILSSASFLLSSRRFFVREKLMENSGSIRPIKELNFFGNHFGPNRWMSWLMKIPTLTSVGWVSTTLNHLLF